MPLDHRRQCLEEAEWLDPGEGAPAGRPGRTGRPRAHSNGSRLAAGLGLALALAGTLAGTVRAQRDFPSELTTVAAVKFEGRHHVPAKELRAVLKTRGPSILPWSDRQTLRLDFLRADTLTIERVYQQHGYLDAVATYRLSPGHAEGSRVVTFVIQEGRRARIGSVRLVGVASVPVREVRRKLLARRGKPFNPLYLSADTTRIADVYHEHGRLPQIVAVAWRESLLVNVRYEVDEGPQYRYGKVYISSPGDLPVAEPLIRRELLLPENQVYRQSRVQRSVERLYETGLFSQVQLTPLVDSTHAEVEFDLRLRARKPRWIDAGVGSGTAERLQMTTQWGHRNLFRRGMQGEIDGRLALDSDARFQVARGQASVLEPWLAGTRTRGIVTGYYEDRRDRADPRWVVSQQARGVTFQLRRELGRYTQLALTQDNTFVTQSTRFNVQDLSPEVVDSLTARYTTHRLQFSVDRDARDTPIDAGRGSVESFAAEVAGGPLRGTSSFQKIHYTNSWYTPVRRGWVLATRVQTGAIAPFGEKAIFTPGLDLQVARVPLEDRFRIGGVNSVRGYDENEIPPSGGLALILGNVELRVPVVGPFGLEMFLDAGNVWARPSYIKGRDLLFDPHGNDAGLMRFAAGAGLRFNLPVGPLRIDVTWASQPDKDGKRPTARPQFAIGPTF